MWRLRPAAEGSFDVMGLGQNSVDHLCQIAAFPSRGEKVEAGAYSLLPGGQVATAILAAHRLGLRACYQGAIGDDALAGIACRNLAQEGVTLRLKVARGGQTQFAIILVDPSGERTIVQKYDPAVVVGPDEVDLDLVARSRVLHLDITDIPAAIRAARTARDAGVLVSLDIDRLLPATFDLLPLVDLLVASEGLPLALGCPDPREALTALARHCPGLICITLGERGCIALWERAMLRVPAFAVEAVDTTGCGDVFRGALIAALFEAMDLPARLRFAAAAAALQAGTVGAQNGVPDRAQVERLLADPPPVHPV